MHSPVSWSLWFLAVINFHVTAGHCATCSVPVILIVNKKAVGFTRSLENEA